MADIREQILTDFSVDISQEENLFKIYKLSGPDLSEQALQDAFDAARKRWAQSVNGANEKNAKRDSARLEKADIYEAILRNDGLRRELFSFYENKSGPGKNENGSSKGVDFAEKYFELIATSKRLSKEDVDFFFEYFQDERKNKKLILEMLKKDFKIIGLNKTSTDEEEDEKTEEGTEEKEEKNKKRPIVVNLFQAKTIIGQKKAISLYEKVRTSPEIQERFPKTKGSLYDFLDLKNANDVKAFSDRISEKKQEAYAIRQEMGTQFVPLVDLYNAVGNLIGKQDVADNFKEFKLLLQYPALTPYMYLFMDMKPDTLKGLYQLASTEYVFRDETDFLLNYFIPVRDNFGISDSGIRQIIKKAKKKAAANKVLNKIDEKTGQKTRKIKIPVFAQILHWLVYWPIFIVYLIFEFMKMVCGLLKKAPVGAFAAVFYMECLLLPDLGVDSIWNFREIFHQDQWIQILQNFLETRPRNVCELILMSLIYIVAMLTLYGLPAMLAEKFVKQIADEMYKQYDWVGVERTFWSIFQDIRKKTEDGVLNNKKKFYPKYIRRSIVNVLCVAFVAAAVYLAPKGFESFDGDYGESYTDAAYESEEDRIPVDDLSTQQTEVSETYDEAKPAGQVEITVDSANVRTGPGTDHGVITVVWRGTVLEMTGEQQTGSNGDIWYEIYLDEEKTQTGWVDEIVLNLQD